MALEARGLVLGLDGRDARPSKVYAGWTRRVILFQLIFFQSILVRTRERISMNRKISSNPRDAVRMDSDRLGSSEKRP